MIQGLLMLLHFFQNKVVNILKPLWKCSVLSRERLYEFWPQIVNLKWKQKIHKQFSLWRDTRVSKWSTELWAGSGRGESFPPTFKLKRREDDRHIHESRPFSSPAQPPSANLRVRDGENVHRSLKRKAGNWEHDIFFCGNHLTEESRRQPSQVLV